MDKVRQVGENYELNKYKTLNRTIELDARLANERLLATKLRLNQVNSMNEKLNKQLRMVQQQYRNQEKKLLLTETMLRQLVDNRDHHRHRGDASIASVVASPIQKRTGGSTLSKLRPGGRQNRGRMTNANASSTPAQVTSADHQLVQSGEASVERESLKPATSGRLEAGAPPAELSAAAGVAVQTNSSATQTQTSRTKMIINDLRQRLNLVGSRGECHRALEACSWRLSRVY